MRVFLCALVVCLSAGRALADESPEARGAELMEAQQYHAALRELEAAYAARQDPHTLLLIARAHQRLGHAGEAIDFYTRFLASGPADPAENAEAEA